MLGASRGFVKNARFLVTVLMILVGLGVMAQAPTPPTSAADPMHIRIEAGGKVSHTDVAGNFWQADLGSLGGKTVNRGNIEIADTLDDHIYQTERYGMSGYALNMADGTYIVRLHFAETYEGITGPGQRVFSINVEGIPINNLDIFAEAGGRNRALVKTAEVQVSDGQLNLVFIPSVQMPEINGIEILPVHRFTGLATIDGQPVADGSEIRAGIPNAVNPGYTSNWHFVTTKGGYYVLEMYSPPGESLIGKTLAFTIQGLPAAQTAKWEPGRVDTLNLTAVSDPVVLGITIRTVVGMIPCIGAYAHCGPGPGDQVGETSLISQGASTRIIVTLPTTPNGKWEGGAELRRNGGCWDHFGYFAVPLTDLTDGQSTTDVPWPINTLLNGTYYVRVYDSASTKLDRSPCARFPKVE